MKENYTSKIFWRCSIFYIGDLFSQSQNIPMLWLVAVLGQLQGVKVEKVIGISTIIRFL